MNRNVIRGAGAAAIAASIEQALHDGRLEARLPTIRELASTLRVSPVTVAAAYRLLRTRGLVVGQGRRGTRVRLSLAPAVATFGARPGPDTRVDLASGNPDPLLLPALAPALKDLGDTGQLYGDTLELPALVSFAAGELRSDGIPHSPVAVTSGTLDAVERVLRDRLAPGDRVGIEDPAFPALVDLLLSIGVTPEPIALDQDGMGTEPFDRALASGVRAVIVSSRAQNPTGAALGRERAAELSRVLRRYPDVTLIEIDDVAVVSGIRLVTLAGGRRHWAVIRSTSKFLGPDLRVAVVTGDEVTIARLRRRQAVTVRWVSHILQALAFAVWSDPARGRSFARAASLYAERRTALVDALAAHGVAAWGRSGFNVWIPVREEAATVLGLAERGWTVCAGERFRLRSPPAIRVTTSALEPPEAVRFAGDLADVAGLRAPAPARGVRAGSG